MSGKIWESCWKMVQELQIFIQLIVFMKLYWVLHYPQTELTFWMHNRVPRSLKIYPVCPVFESHNLFNTWQFGFIKNKSTTQGLDKLVTDVIQSFKSKFLAQATLCDHGKAFDCVDSRDPGNKLFPCQSHFAMGTFHVYVVNLFLFT